MIKSRDIKSTDEYLNSEEHLNTQEKLWSRDFILILLANLFTFIGFYMLLPTLPVYAKKLGGEETIAGMVIGLFTASAVIIRPFAGRALDTYGRKAVYLLGLGIFILSVIVYNWVPSVLFLLLLRLVHGLGWGACTTAAGTIAADIIPKKKLGEGMGYFGIASTIAMAIAPALGLGILAKFHDNFTYLFALSTSMIIIAVIISLNIRYIKISKENNESKGSLFETNAFKPSSVALFIGMTYGAIVSFIALYAYQRGIENIGPFFTVMAVTMIISRPISGRLADKKGFSTVIIPGIISVLITMLLFSQANNLFMFLLGGIIYGIGFGSVTPSLQAMAVQKLSPQRRGAANGTFYSAFDLGIGAGSILGGIVAQALSYSQMYLTASLPAGIALVLYISIGRQEKE